MKAMVLSSKRTGGVPFLNENQLCVIYQELGEQALCDVCTDTPRDFLEYGGARELALSASCPEAGRLIYRNKEKMKVVEKEISEPFPWEETEDEQVLADEIQLARNQAIAILQNRFDSCRRKGLCLFRICKKKYRIV